MTDELGCTSYDRQEPVENITTWVYETDSFVPCAKLVNNERYSIISDYIGRPIQAYDDAGSLVWETDYDIYGNLENLKGDRNFISFRQLGQYEDEETGLYYNRYRYYSPDSGTYISQDPIGLLGNNPTLYAYVSDTNAWVDVFGLECGRPGGYKSGDVDAHGNLSSQKNRAPGHSGSKADNQIQSHHPIQDAWADMRINGYSRNSAPATLLPSSSGMSHANISATQRGRRRIAGGWDTTLKQEFNISYKEMIDAGVSPKQAQKALKDSYKYFDGLRSLNKGNSFFDI